MKHSNILNAILKILYKHYGQYVTLNDIQKLLREAFNFPLENNELPEYLEYLKESVYIQIKDEPVAATITVSGCIFNECGGYADHIKIKEQTEQNLKNSNKNEMWLAVIATLTLIVSILLVIYYSMSIYYLHNGVPGVINNPATN